MTKIPIRKTLAIVYVSLLLILFIYIRTFWTPDILFGILFVFFLIIGQAKRFIVYFLPFILLLLSYEQLRSFASQINKHVHFLEMVRFDKWVFHGILPTVWLQQHLYFGHVAWYDFYFYFLYMLHFVTPICLALLIWKYKTKDYWLYIVALLLLSYSAFITYLLFPAAPPWMASNMHLITPIHHISSDVWAAFGVKNFSAYYNELSPNTVAAVPSLHAAYPLLFSLFIRKLWGNKWFCLSLIYPISIWVGVIYLGEHYFMDVALGIIYAVVSFMLSKYVLRFLSMLYSHINVNLRNKINKLAEE